jgi:hypothetical protein
MAIDVNTLIRKAKTLSNGVHGAVNVGQGLRNVPAEKHYSRGQMLNFAQQCAGIADAVMGLPDNGRGDRADANRLFASAGGKFYELANDITGTAHQFSFQIANAPDNLIVTGIKVLERMASGKSAKAAAVVAAAKAVGTPQVKALDPAAVRKSAAVYVRNIRASLQRGYVAVEWARSLNTLLTQWASQNPDSRTADTARRAAMQLQMTLLRQPGQDMRDVTPEVAGVVKDLLQKIVTQLQSRY